MERWDAKSTVASLTLIALNICSGVLPMSSTWPRRLLLHILVQSVIDLMASRFQLMDLLRPQILWTLDLWPPPRMAPILMQKPFSSVSMAWAHGYAFLLNANSRSLCEGHQVPWDWFLYTMELDILNFPMCDYAWKNLYTLLWRKLQGFPLSTSTRRMGSGPSNNATAWTT